MATYDFVFEAIGLQNWCTSGEGADAPMSMEALTSQASGEEAATSIWELPFPSMDRLNDACPAFPQSRNVTKGLEEGFLNVKDSMSFVLDPLTQPLSWLLEGALYGILNTPWWIVIPALMLIVWFVSKSWQLLAFVTISIGGLAFIDYYSYAMQTLAIIMVCAILCVLLGVPIGIAMSRSDKMRAGTIPILDMLQTLPPFVYLIPLIFLFSVTEPKLYGIAIILYAIVPVIRLTDLGIRMVDQSVIEAAEAFGMTDRQKLYGVQDAAGAAQHHGRCQPDDHDEPRHGGDRLAGLGTRAGRAGAARHPQPRTGRRPDLGAWDRAAGGDAGPGRPRHRWRASTRPINR